MNETPEQLKAQNEELRAANEKLSKENMQLRTNFDVLNERVKSLERISGIMNQPWAPRATPQGVAIPMVNGLPVAHTQSIEQHKEYAIQRVYKEPGSKDFVRTPVDGVRRNYQYTEVREHRNIRTRYSNQRGMYVEYLDPVSKTWVDQGITLKTPDALATELRNAAAEREARLQAERHASVTKARHIERLRSDPLYREHQRIKNLLGDTEPQVSRYQKSIVVDGAYLTSRWAKPDSIPSAISSGVEDYHFVSLGMPAVTPFQGYLERPPQVMVEAQPIGTPSPFMPEILSGELHISGLTDKQSSVFERFRARGFLQRDPDKFAVFVDPASRGLWLWSKKDNGLWDVWAITTGGYVQKMDTVNTLPTYALLGGLPTSPAQMQRAEDEAALSIITKGSTNPMDNVPASRQLDTMQYLMKSGRLNEAAAMLEHWQDLAKNQDAGKGVGLPRSFFRELENIYILQGKIDKFGLLLAKHVEFYPEEASSLHVAAKELLSEQPPIFDAAIIIAGIILQVQKDDHEIVDTLAHGYAMSPKQTNVIKRKVGEWLAAIGTSQEIGILFEQKLDAYRGILNNAVIPTQGAAAQPQNSNIESSSSQLPNVEPVDVAPVVHSSGNDSQELPPIDLLEEEQRVRVGAINFQIGKFIDGSANVSLDGNEIRFTLKRMPPEGYLRSIFQSSSRGNITDAMINGKNVTLSVDPSAWDRVDVGNILGNVLKNAPLILPQEAAKPAETAYEPSPQEKQKRIQMIKDGFDAIIQGEPTVYLRAADDLPSLGEGYSYITFTPKEKPSPSQMSVLDSISGMEVAHYDQSENKISLHVRNPDFWEMNNPVMITEKIVEYSNAK